MVDAKVDKLKAFTITRREGRKNVHLNAEELIPKALDNNAYDLLVIEMGVNEISNLNISKEKQPYGEAISNGPPIHHRLPGLEDCLTSQAAKVRQYTQGEPEQGG